MNKAPLSTSSSNPTTAPHPAQIRASWASPRATRPLSRVRFRIRVRGRARRSEWRGDHGTAGSNYWRVGASRLDGSRFSVRG